MSGLITFEGIDGTGKSTLVRALAARASAIGVRCWQTAEPTEGPIGQLLADRAVRMASAPAQALLFVADRYDHQASIEAHIAAGQWVLCDRYDLSTFAYQSVLLERQTDPRHSLSEPLAWLGSLHGRSMRTPDATILLLGRVEQMLGRTNMRGGGQDRRFERVELLEEVQRRYEQVAGAAAHGRLFGLPARRVSILDATASSADLAQAGWDALVPLLDPAYQPPAAVK